MSREDKKARKRAQLQKNRYHQMLFGFVRQRRAEESRVKALEDKLKPKPGQKPDSKVSDKVATIRNRLTGKQRVSRERWNRFAGTSGGGGRGL